MLKVKLTTPLDFFSNKKIKNPCIRCGKERIILKSWQEKVVNGQGVTVSSNCVQMICPDSECQKIVEISLAALKKKKEELALEKERKNLERISLKKKLA